MEFLIIYLGRDISRRHIFPAAIRDISFAKFRYARIASRKCIFRNGRRRKKETEKRAGGHLKITNPSRLPPHICVPLSRSPGIFANSSKTAQGDRKSQVQTMISKLRFTRGNVIRGVPKTESPNFSQFEN